MIRKHLVLALVLSSAVSGCSGPKARTRFTSTAVTVDVAFGAPAPSTAPAGPTVLVPAPSGVGVVPVPLQAVPVVPATETGSGAGLPTDPCPSAGATSRLPADVIISSLAPAGRYALRFVGRLVEGASARVVQGTGAMIVHDAAAGPDGRTSSFVVDTEMAGLRTSLTYAVVPADVSAAGSSAGGQLLLRQATGQGGLGVRAAFQPDTPVELFAQPANQGTTWTSAGSDVLGRTVATVEGSQGPRTLVNACGQGIEAWDATDVVRTVSTDQDLTSTVRTLVATQYGGLPVAQVETYTGTAAGAAVSGTFQWTLSVDPGARR